MNKLIYLFICLLFYSCLIDRTILEISNIERDSLNEFQNIKGDAKLVISDQSEPGEKIAFCLTFVDAKSKRSLGNQAVHFYHASADGNYEPSDPNDESTARFSGQAITNLMGQIYLETILPGDYGSSNDNRHIHTTVFTAKPEAYDIHFKQYTGYMGNRFIQRSDQHFLADLKRTEENKLVVFLTIEVKNPSYLNN